MAITDLPVTELSTNTNMQAGVVFNGNSTSGRADSGHKFLNDGDVFMLVTKSTTNGAITFATPAVAQGGGAIAELAITVETTDAPIVIGPFPPSAYNQTDGKVYVTYEGGEETEFEVLPFKMVKQR